MATTNYAAREIDCKVVYYGPASSGKTTNLRQVHDRLDPETRGTLISPTVDGGRTLFFDFLPVDLGSVQGFTTRFHLYTVPGQPAATESRRRILRGVDGVIFVADSFRERLEENLASLEDLVANLEEHGLRLDRLPHVLQYNKRDLSEAAPIPELEGRLNGAGAPSFEAIAIRGEGVFEPLTTVAKQVIRNLA